METSRRRRSCATMEVHRRLLNRDATYRANRADIETKSRAYQRVAYAREGVTKIPVVVHVVYKTDEQNVSVEQVASQIDVLNSDYRAKNPDIANVPSVWRALIGDVSVQFELAKTDPQGNATDGIVRKQTHVAGFADDDVVKFDPRGGSDA